ncbi:DUF4258 domain-containing protein [Pontibacterium sp. N1Y112]|uniref:DUF4258 domain-containing protein n=1 Tax=Pontibacterium sinense TaxID=2781979 RepID=A0A8J7JYT1_9GAMM|nr:DUF4258 domain-containing protein [Pontibacterium sinense]MBE9396809.1 DUF4258 domain-containing protein [Pontibacterium sinense]
MRDVIVDTNLTQADKTDNDEHFELSHHAQTRMSQRSINLGEVQSVLQHGRVIHSRRARFYVVGHKDVERFSHAGIDVRALENIQVVVDEISNRILTVYRNRNFRQIRPTSRRERGLH